jgi:xylulokinase
MAYWMGIDTGTGSTRALLTDETGRVCHSFTAPHADMVMEQPLWAEQHPDDWWRGAQEAIRGVLTAADVTGDAIQAVGFSGQMHGATMLDAEGNPVRPALIWCDQRSQPQVDWINDTAGAERVVAWTANPVLTGFTLPKFLWVRDHQPELFARVRYLMLPKDFIRFRLSGELGADVSDASGTALFDVVGRQWSAAMCDAVGVNPSILPPVFESSAICARVSAAGAAITGLRQGTPLVAGAGDQAASAIGNGIVRSGVVSCTLGTSGVVFAHLDQPAYDPQGRIHTFCHAVPGKWHAMGVTQGAGLSLQWFRTQLAPTASYDSLMAEAETAPAGSDGLFWLPYLMGERTPHLDPHARGGWIGLTASHQRRHLIRAVIEGVSYSQRDCLDLIDSLGAPASTVRASGGGANSAFWRQILAEVFGRPVSVLESQEGSAYGAALLAMAGSGAYASVDEACARAIQVVSTTEPSENRSVYESGHRIYRALYPALKAAGPA